ncbi:MAG: hypothetical protein JOZ39_01705 [Chloroflexi bacterium]|nr:hypothetical protein [Chloroflexota bacterium]
MALRTTVVGSWSVPESARDEMARYYRGELPPSEADDVLNSAATEAIRQQRELGLTEWTSGELYTRGFVGHLPSRLAGLKKTRDAAALIVDYDDQEKWAITGPLSAPEGLGHAANFRRESALAGGVPKATVPGVLETAANVEPWPDIQAHIPELIGIVNSELRALQAAGCQNIQVDVPRVSCAVPMGWTSADDAARLIAAPFQGITTTKSIHMCCGGLGGKPYSSVLRMEPWVDILERLDGVIDLAVLEFSYNGQWMEREALKRVPKSIQIAAGIACTKSPPEPVDKLKQRAEELARIVGEDRLWLSPSCGLRGRSWEYLRDKVGNMVEAAQAV